jgi:Subtilase family
MTRRSLACLAALGAVLLAAPAARAADAPFTVSLPGGATAASVRADPSTWIVGAVPGRRAAAVAARFGARRIGLRQTGGYVVPRARARALAAALHARRLLAYAQPNGYAHLDAVPDDPLSVPPNAWRARVVSPALDPPAVTPTSPLIALVDAQADTTHPEWTGDPNFTSLGGQPLTNLHGTATAAVAAAPANGIGILGVWPGARALNVPLPDTITCDDSARQIATAITQILGPSGTGRGVINMSYGSPDLCLPEYVELQYATGAGIVLAAAGGNDGAAGSPLEFPGSLPHVLTVAAVGPNDEAPGFSNVSNAMDVSAPGVGIETAVPVALDEDPVKDGYEALSGTSFAAPMVAAAAAWVEAARPQLRGDQVAQVVRRSARDVGPKGWDQNTGFGALDIDRALTFTAPPHDPTEPNDNIVWVDGTAFSKADPLLWAGGSRVHLSASVNPYEDFADVYRIRIPAHHRASMSAAARTRGVTLSVFRKGAKSINDNRRRVGYSHRRGRDTERVSLTNSGARAHVYYVCVRPQGVSRSRDVYYTLRVR